jgi:excinuclease ABC subunit C
VDKLKNKLKKLPTSPGVYFHKNSKGEIIYVGKAAKLRNRVRQYFQSGSYKDPKTELLIAEIADVDWIEVESEAEALFLEAEMIHRYMPHYNILLRDDKSNAYIRINLKDKAPSVTVMRQPIDDGAQYFGPFLAAGSVRKALRHLRKAFPFSTHLNVPDRACLQYHLGLCPGPETDQYDRKSYLKNLKKLILYIKGESGKAIKALENEMNIASLAQNYEQAAILRNRLRSLKALQSQVIFGDRETIDLSKDHALYDIKLLFSLPNPPRRIEGFDISHMSGSDTVASLVVFTNGAAEKTAYRKFKMRALGNDDFLHMQEAVGRRLQSKNLKAWGKPNLILVDGGKGQLSAAIKARDDLGLNVPMIGLAKRDEEIIISKKYSNISLNEAELKKLKGYKTETTEFISLLLPKNSHIVKLLQRIRDESHRFAISYHNVLRAKRQTSSILDEIPGVGPATRKKLLKTFGSTKNLRFVSDIELQKSVGKKAKIIRQYFPYAKPANTPSV